MNQNMNEQNQYNKEPKEPNNKRKLTLSRTNKMIAGVCGGFADYFKLDATIIRIVVVALGLITAGFPIVIFYVACWAIMPLDESI